MTSHGAPPGPNELLALDLDAERAQIVDFLQAEIRRLPRHSGFVIGLSGGIDSALVAALTVEAVGAENVRALLLPERESSPDGRRIAVEVANHLGIDRREFDLTPILTQLGVYEEREALIRRRIPDFGEGWTYRLVLPGDLRESAAMNVYSLEVFDPAGDKQTLRLRLAELRLLQSATNVKQRLRMLELYREAERRGALVAGTTNRTEMETGFFVRHGDGGVDVEALAGLYKTQVFALARHMGLPASVIEVSPSPDTWSAGVSDEEFFLRLPYELVDVLLAGEAAGLTKADLTKRCEMSEDEVDNALHELHRRRDLSARLRELPPAPPEETP